MNKDNPLCKGAEIFSYYERMALDKVGDKMPVVLKTDLYNESERQYNNKNILKALSPHIKKGYGIEIDINVYNEACEILKGYKNLDLRPGSITELPFDNESIDILFDLSTIDHIISYKKALREYQRVIKPDGECIIIVWVTNGNDRESYKKQYCFNQAKFEKNLKDFFKIHDQKLLLFDKTLMADKFSKDRRLVEYDLGILKR